MQDGAQQLLDALGSILTQISEQPKQTQNAILHQLTSHGADELMDIDATCAFFGGTRPIDRSTLYRGIKAELYPRPIKFGGSSRWLRSECLAAVRAQIERRGQGSVGSIT